MDIKTFSTFLERKVESKNFKMRYAPKFAFFWYFYFPRKKSTV